MIELSASTATSYPLNSFVADFICCYVKQLNRISCVENNASSANRQRLITYSLTPLEDIAGYRSDVERAFRCSRDFR